MRRIHLLLLIPIAGVAFFLIESKDAGFWFFSMFILAFVSVTEFSINKELARRVELVEHNPWKRVIATALSDMKVPGAEIAIREPESALRALVCAVVVAGVLQHRESAEAQEAQDGAKSAV